MLTQHREEGAAFYSQWKVRGRRFVVRPSYDSVAPTCTPFEAVQGSTLEAVCSLCFWISFYLLFLYCWERKPSMFQERKASLGDQRNIANSLR